jgi:hypothetical protein
MHIVPIDVTCLDRGDRNTTHFKHSAPALFLHSFHFPFIFPFPFLQFDRYSSSSSNYRYYLCSSCPIELHWHLRDVSKCRGIIAVIGCSDPRSGSKGTSISGIQFSNSTPPPFTKQRKKKLFPIPSNSFNYSIT